MLPDLPWLFVVGLMLLDPLVSTFFFVVMNFAVLFLLKPKDYYCSLPTFKLCVFIDKPCRAGVVLDLGSWTRFADYLLFDTIAGFWRFNLGDTSAYYVNYVMLLGYSQAEATSGEGIVTGPS